jgi:hypothetical protein
VKKLFAIAFTCVYLTLTVGVVHTTHYCMGRVKSSALFSYETVKCPCFVLSGERGSCCKDSHEILKIDDDHAASAVVSVAPSFFEMGQVFVDNNPLSQKSQEFQTSFDDSSPPLDPIPLFTKHCSLVFYDDEMIA